MRREKNRGSATVEACFVVPLFLFFMLAMAEIYMLLIADAHIHQSLAEAADYMAGASYMEYKKTQSLLLEDAVMNAQIRKYIGGDFYVERMVKGGVNGIVVTVKNDADNPKIFHARADYIAEFNIPLIGGHNILLRDEIKQKRFIGFGPEEKSDVYVYVTPERSVYHVTRGCTHLSLQYGSKSSSKKGSYVPCSFCGSKSDNGRIFVSRTNNVYHTSMHCSGLKRTVMRIKKEEAAGLSPCSRCGGK